MKRPLIVRPDAKTDVREIHDYLLEHNERTVANFEIRINRLFARIESMPFLYGKVWRYGSEAFGTSFIMLSSATGSM